MNLLKIFFSILLSSVYIVSYSQTVSDKRGFGGDLHDMADLKAASKFSWFYNWGQKTQGTIENEVKDYIDYTPMAWGNTYDRQALRTFLSNHPEVEYLLGFNEPNFLEQANLTPSQAAALWPELETIADEFNLKLVSPAVNFCWTEGAVKENGKAYIDPVEYLDDFFAALPDTSRVDYIAVHGYFDNAGALPWYISLFEKYNKPIWLTEFNHSAGTTTETSQQNYMVEAVDYLENEPKVFRYAWLLTRNPNQLNTNLFYNNVTGQLTDLGLIYANMSSYDDEYYHAAGDTIQTEHYVDMAGIHLVKIGDASGILAAHDFDGDDWMEYNVRVDRTDNYKLKIRLTSIWESSFSLFDGNHLIGTFTTPITSTLGTWETVTYDQDIHLTEGTHQLKFVLHGGGWQLNWLQFSGAGTATSINTIENETLFKLYPNPLRLGETLEVETSVLNYSLSIIDLKGNTLIKKSALSGNRKIDTSYLVEGYYVVKIDHQNQQHSKKIIIQ